VDRVAKRLVSKKIKLQLTEAAYDFLSDCGYDPVYGARPVKRAVQQQLETLLAKYILRGDLSEDDTALVDVSADGTALSVGVMVGTPGSVPELTV
ncbi:Chaperone protein ClpB3, chloroplastic, partial [Cymbomonas tetramitiformis]